MRQAYGLLFTLGIDRDVAIGLAEVHTSAEIRQQIRYARQKGARHLAGYVRRTLELIAPSREGAVSQVRLRLVRGGQRKMG